MSEPIQEEFKTDVALIGACSILHNALLIREDDSALLDVGDYSSYDHQGSQHYMDAEMEDSRIDGKAFDIRSALATKLREFHKS